MATRLSQVFGILQEESGYDIWLRLRFDKPGNCDDPRQLGRVVHSLDEVRISKKVTSKYLNELLKG